MSRMLYLKDEGAQKIDGFNVKYHIFADEDIDAALKEGWAKTPGEAHEEKKPAKRGKKKAAE